jgi:hypothetical protein
MLFGYDSNSNRGAHAGLLTTDSEHAMRLQEAIDNVGKVLVVNSDGTVAMDQDNPDYALLSDGDVTFGKAEIAVLNSKIQEGLIHINQDLSADWLGPSSQCERCYKGTKCKTHWYGEVCSVSSHTTRDICIGLESGEGALIICSLIPILDVACEIIEVVGAIPLEAEICPCSDKGSGSTFHVTWVGAAWFTCS